MAIKEKLKALKRSRKNAEDESASADPAGPSRSLGLDRATEFRALEARYAFDGAAPAEMADMATDQTTDLPPPPAPTPAPAATSDDTGSADSDTSAVDQTTTESADTDSETSTAEAFDNGASGVVADANETVQDVDDVLAELEASIAAANSDPVADNVESTEDSELDATSLDDVTTDEETVSDADTSLESADTEAVEPVEAVTDDSVSQFVFVDDHVDGYDALLESLTADVVADTDYEGSLEDLVAQLQDVGSADVGDIRIVVVDHDSDGFEQIDAAMDGHVDVDTVHIVSHGSHGNVFLGNTVLTEENFDNHEQTIAAWADNLAEGADILLYGCDVTSTESGHNLAARLGAAAGADVAASRDATGNGADANWVLEDNFGAVESFAFQASADWGGTLSIFTVTNTNDSGAGSLRDAIDAANANGTGADEIKFNIPVTDGGHFYYQDDGIAGQVSTANITVTTAATDNLIGDIDPDFAHSWFSIQLDSALANLYTTVTIDGGTQPNAIGGVPMIEIDGSNAGTGARGLTATTGNSAVIHSLVINNFDGSGIQTDAANMNLTNTYIGTDVSGTIDQGNGGWGIEVYGDNHNIGDGSATNANVISGNTLGNVQLNGENATVAGNFIGTDASGTAAIETGSGGDGIEVTANNNTIGGSTAAESNVISGNVGDGVEISLGVTGTVVENNLIVGTHITDNTIGGNKTAGIHLDGGSNAVVTGNYVGTDSGETVDLGNEEAGISITNDSSTNMIGGTGTGDGNVVAYNGDTSSPSAGVEVSGDGAIDNTIVGNSIYENEGIAIDLVRTGFETEGETANDPGDADTGPNELVNTPTFDGIGVTPAGNVIGSWDMDAEPNTDYRIDIYTDDTGNGELKSLLHSMVITTNGTGIAGGGFNLPSGGTVAVGHSISMIATKTDAVGGLLSTSEASPGIVLTPHNAAPTITSDGGANNTSLSVAENTTAVTTVTATDPENDTLTYSISGGLDQSLFNINATTGVVTFSTAPDFENPIDSNTNNVYSITVTADDGNGNSDSQNINITVTDVNEFAPNITSDGGNATAGTDVAENSTLVTTVTATDADPGDTVTYSIVGGTDQAFFSIDSVTGDLSFVTAPDFETAADGNTDNTYEVQVQAEDSAGNTDTQALSVDVKNLNEAPDITSGSGAPAITHVLYGENQTWVTNVDAVDPDAGATITYSVSGGPDASLFTIDANTGELTWISAPDFENPISAAGTNSYSLEVTATDEFGLTDVQTHTVNVRDINEAPEITSDGGGTTANVNTPEGTTGVTTVVATDPENDTLTYSISGGVDQSLFSINATTGVVTFNAAPDFNTPLDADTNNVYEITVTTDDGNGLSDTQDISVTVTNTNQAPVISSDGAGTTATLNRGENFLNVTTVTATDADADTLSYSIVGGADQTQFTINSATGDLSFASNPDFENPADVGSNNSYEVEVEVSDGNGGTDTQTITVTIADQQEVPVIISDGAGPTATVNVQENQTAVTTVAATDQDAGDTLSYSIIGGADSTLFSVNATTGDLTFNSAPDFENPGDSNTDNAYEVEVRVSDGAGGFDSQIITVNVTNTNDAPDITSDGGAGTAAINVQENTTAVTTVVATDPDGDTLTYSITGGTDQTLFTINSVTGALTFTSGPDFESPTDSNTDNVYSVEVMADDGNGATVTQTIDVTVTDNNEAPTITSDGGGISASVNVVEGTTAATTVAATDPEGDTLNYAITGGADQSLFTINPTTGAVSFNTAPDYTSPADANGDNTYEIVVEVDDGNGQGDTQTISVNVTDTNYSPVITSDGGVANLVLNRGENFPGVTTLTATDADGDALTYSIVGGVDQAHFTLDANTGQLSWVSMRDFENPTDADGNNDYEVQVEVADGNGGTDIQTITVNITNMQDLPEITSDGAGATANINMSENQTAVTTVVAVDQDTNANISYSISGGLDQSLFSIDATTGALTFNAAPDFEAPGDSNGDNSYEVTVEASDGTGGLDWQTLTITITGGNDAPDITSDGGTATASVNVNENQNVVTTATATDADGDALTYAIVGGTDQSLFNIDTNTGDITFVSSPDFENPTDANLDNTYEVQVQVADGNGGFDLQTISVAVADAPEAPVITSNGGGTTATVNVQEPQTAVTTVTATDPDASSTLTYSIGGGLDQAMFSINSTTGALTFNSPPDFDSVQVTDNTGAVTTQALTVNVTALNEAPTIVSDGGTGVAIHNVAENTTAITTVAATDPDGDALTYLISGGSDAAQFSLDSATGELSFLTGRDFENPLDLDGNAACSLCESPSSTSTRHLLLTVAAEPAL